jgi:hypothetical protein
VSLSPHLSISSFSLTFIIFSFFHILFPFFPPDDPLQKARVLQMYRTPGSIPYLRYGIYYNNHKRRVLSSLLISSQCHNFVTTVANFSFFQLGLFLQISVLFKNIIFII